MEIQYDENLATNPFFQRLKQDHPELIEAASVQKFIMCVPRIGSFTDVNNVSSHILVPNIELPESHFNTEDGEVVKTERKLLYRARSGGSLEVNILFEEIFYTKDFSKYKVWVIDRPLKVQGKAQPNWLQVNSLNEAIKFIWNEVNLSNSKYALKKIDTSISNFRKNNSRCSDLEKLRNNIHLLYNHCIDILLMNRKLKEKCKADNFLMKNLKLAVETYTINALYNHIFDLVTCFTADENERFNKTIRNLADMQMHELNVEPKLQEFVPAMRCELNKIDAQTTVLDKLGCLKKALNVISERYNKKSASMKILTTDDVIPALIFVIIKSGLCHWITNLHFLKQFSFTEFGSAYGAENYLIATLEAAITYIMQNADLHKETPKINVEKMLPDAKFDNKEEYLDYLFEMIQLNDEAEVSRLLAPFMPNGGSTTMENPLFTPPQLCHPLCDCLGCQTKIIESTPSPNSINKKGLTAIFVPVMYGLPKMVTLLLSFKADVNVVDEECWTPLHHAAAKGHQNILLLLLHAKADINAVNRDQNTPLHLSCLYGNTNCCKALLYFAEHMKIPLEIDGQNKCGDTALHIAAKWGFLEMVNTLLESNARVDAQNKHGQTPVHVAHGSKIREVLHNMREMPKGTPNVCITETDMMDSNETRSPLLNKLDKIDRVMTAIITNDTKLVMFLLGISEERKKCHPLCACNDCTQNKASSVIDVNDQDASGNASLHIAARMGNTPLVRILLENGGDPLVVNHLKQTPLHLACSAGKAQVCNCILTASTRFDIIDAQDINGDTALSVAVATGDAKLIEILLKFEPNLDLKNSVGQTPLDIAKEKILPNVTKLLEDCSERPNFNSFFTESDINT